MNEPSTTRTQKRPKTTTIRRDRRRTQPSDDIVALVQRDTSSRPNKRIKHASDTQCETLADKNIKKNQLLHLPLSRDKPSPVCLLG